MKNLEELCRKIELPTEVTEAVVAYDRECEYPKLEKSMDKLFARETWDEGRAELKELLGEDERGIHMLTCMLKSALKTYELYQQAGIDEEIYIETMKCFNRFVREHMVSYGVYGFDRDFWTARQISGLLLRIGELEYEMVNENGEKYISLHIPSDARMESDRLEQSFETAKEFINEKFPEYAGCEAKCFSWLLSPTLQKVLNEDSRILAFQRLFAIETTGREEVDHFEWVFKNPQRTLVLADLPEETSLQKRLKQYLLDGGKVENARGTLKVW